VSSTPAVSRPVRYRKVLVLHGPNLNLLGTREPQTYGHTTLDDINEALAKRAAEAGIGLDTFQSNHEGALVDRIQAARGEGGLHHHQSGGLYPYECGHARCAAGVAIPFVEVHLSNVHRREPFRHHSYFSDQAIGVICGLGWQGYLLALDYALAQEQTASSG
jgi:3-dehydroquinate dehydratase-2